MTSRVFKPPEHLKQIVPRYILNIQAVTFCILVSHIFGAVMANPKYAKKAILPFIKVLVKLLVRYADNSTDISKTARLNKTLACESYLFSE